MAPFQLFRSFLPLHNPIGFGPPDWIELEVAVLLVLLLFAYSKWSERARRFAANTRLCMIALFLAPVLLRLALLPHSPVPIGAGADDFAHLLVGDTLRHFRLANPSHPLHQFFETVFVLQHPTYSSIFPIGQGMFLALGQLIFHLPWTGVLLSCAAMCPLCYWMLRGWTTPGWALAGGLLALFEFGPLRYWMNTYWGGAVSAVAGCLIFGALPRLRAYGRRRDAALLGAGLGLQLMARPFECILVAVAVVLFFIPDWRRGLRAAPLAILMLVPFLGLALLHNQQVTGSWAALPYQLSRYQYGVPTTFTFQPNPTPHVSLTADQQLDYDAQVIVHGKDPETVKAYGERLLARIRFYRFFFPAPLYLVLPFFLLTLRDRRFAWVAAAVLILALGTNFYPYFYPHYIAAAVCLFVLIAVTALERLSRLKVRGYPAGHQAAVIVGMLCGADFLFWYGFHLVPDNNESMAVRQFETWNFVNHGDPDGRIAVRGQLSAGPGKQLVFVRYWPRHLFDEWVQNEAEIDRARVVWALDLGSQENEKLTRYYPDRTAWLLEPDARPPKLSPYRQEPPPVPETSTRKPPEAKSPPNNSGIQLLPIQ